MTEKKSFKKVNRDESETGKQLFCSHLLFWYYIDRNESILGKTYNSDTHACLESLTHLFYFHVDLNVNSWFSLGESDRLWLSRRLYFYVIQYPKIASEGRSWTITSLLFLSVGLCRLLWISVWFLLALSKSAWQQSIIKPLIEHWRFRRVKNFYVK